MIVFLFVYKCVPRIGSVDLARLSFFTAVPFTAVPFIAVPFLKLLFHPVFLLFLSFAFIEVA